MPVLLLFQGVEQQSLTIDAFPLGSGMNSGNSRAKGKGQALASIHAKGNQAKGYSEGHSSRQTKARNHSSVPSASIADKMKFCCPT